MTGGLFVIQELTGDERRLALGGRALPSLVNGQGTVAFGIEVKTKKTTYPGNANSTIQVLGPSFDDTVISGIWKERFLSDQIEASGFPDLTDGDGVVTPAQLVAAFYSLAKSGNAIRVSWGPVVREGVLKKFVDTWYREQDVGWEATFEWNADDEPARRAAPATPEPTTELRQDMSRTDDAATSRPNTLNPSVGEQVKTTTSSRRQIAGQVFDAVRAIQNAVPGTNPVDAVASLVSSAGDMLALMNSSGAQLADVPYTQLQVSDSPLAVLSAESWRRTLVREQDRLAAHLVRRARVERARVAPSSIAIVRMREATTLRSLAIRYYGSADDWQRIADANGVNGSMVPAGTVIVIPPRGA